jgi:DNA-binding NarL/FixJ family response regulator
MKQMTSKIERTRLILVDDHPLFREGVAITLAGEPDLEVVGQGISADDAVELTRRLQPDIVLLDLDLPGGGLSMVKQIAAAHASTKILILTASTNDEHVIAALKMGVQGYVLKGISARELIRIIRDVRAGKGYVPPELAANLITGITSPNTYAPASPFDELTEREREILDLVASGSSNKEIANVLGLTEKTVKYYMTNIMQKLHVRNRVEAALLAREIEKQRREV